MTVTLPYASLSRAARTIHSSIKLRSSTFAKCQRGRLHFHFPQRWTRLHHDSWALAKTVTVFGNHRLCVCNPNTKSQTRAQIIIVCCSDVPQDIPALSECYGFRQQDRGWASKDPKMCKNKQSLRVTLTRVLTNKIEVCWSRRQSLEKQTTAETGRFRSWHRPSNTFRVSDFQQRLLRPL